MQKQFRPAVARRRQGQHCGDLSSELARLRMVAERNPDRSRGWLPDGTVVQVSQGCPQCRGGLFDPQDKEIVAQCLLCGTSLYSSAPTGKGL